jgi:hypothetical protein
MGGKPTFRRLRPDACRKAKEDAQEIGNISFKQYGRQDRMAPIVDGTVARRRASASEANGAMICYPEAAY